VQPSLDPRKLWTVNRLRDRSSQGLASLSAPNISRTDRNLFRCRTREPRNSADVSTTSECRDRHVHGRQADGPNAENLNFAVRADALWRIDGFRRKGEKRLSDFLAKGTDRGKTCKGAPLVSEEEQNRLGHGPITLRCTTRREQARSVELPMMLCNKIIAVLWKNSACPPRSRRRSAELQVSHKTPDEIQDARLWPMPKCRTETFSAAARITAGRSENARMALP